MIRRFKRFMFKLCVAVLVCVAFNVYLYQSKGKIEQKIYKYALRGAVAELRQTWSKQHRTARSCRYCAKAGYWHGRKHASVRREIKNKWN